MKVLLILVDGMRPDAIAELSEFKDFAAKGAVSLEGRTVMPSVTLPCHMSMFHGVDPEHALADYIEGRVELREALRNLR